MTQNLTKGMPTQSIGTAGKYRDDYCVNCAGPSPFSDS
ncbi:hypothetical protein ALO82_101428 [Pseudomonas syringae pv. broussonetiae]|uniref:Uncharacterized protein n=5 Tax=Pseudomonas syringae group genomosp. 2 TaxID=251698 RepID=A0A3M6HEK6_PSEAJ|nr:Unknown protein sequence [Pseudomonas savastanoi pv. phaseolicola]KPB61432.1 Unknown protein sequence [Pseudomonas amygdali pv. mellea]KPB80562.1 Unknown protein sequence [Pseudomonas syringae pv. maculicola]KPW52903.1 hypothetical protein ALO82_101428 [Pseudomonas syringae pv. broussonetiae]KPX84222.1 hypothetical protein ALO63_101510 [Pseudomonas amygdali pv. mori]RML34780.1 hypothetical protein ALQ97_101676 [Pseudomonas savastanoi pv. glycinea]RMS24317.1 hypothetical protein ALP70_10155